MDSNTVIGLIAVLVVIALGVGVWLLIRRSQAKERARIKALSPEERELWDAEQDWKLAVSNATRAHAVEVKAYDRRVREATKAHADALALGSKRLGTYRGLEGTLTVTELTISTPEGTFPLDDSVKATVDTLGNLTVSNRSTFTRVAVGGLLFGAAGAVVGAVAKKNKRHDNRELYLMVESSTFATLLTCKPDDGPRVRQLALTIRQAGLQAEQMNAYRDDQVPRATKALEQARASVGDMERSKRTLEDTKANKSRIDAATAAISALQPRPAIEP